MFLVVQLCNLPDFYFYFFKVFRNYILIIIIIKMMITIMKIGYWIPQTKSINGLMIFIHGERKVLFII